MEKTFAVIKNDIVENAIVAESIIIAQSLLPNFTLVEVTEYTGPAAIGGEFRDGVFMPKKPFDSWLWDSENKIWNPPIKQPDMEFGFYDEWNEETQGWDRKEIPGFADEVQE